MIPGTCNYRTETTVLAHVGSHGTAKRQHDEDGVFACSDCHDAIDRRSKRFLAHDREEQEKLNQDRRFYIASALERMKIYFETN
jgi:hypothetical protein